MNRFVEKFDIYKLVVILSSICCTICFFYPVIGHLNTSLFNFGGDCIKNYYNYLYYIRYDRGSQLTGMGYPFGENIIFTDNIPVLAASISLLKNIFPGIGNYGLFILHFLILLSFTIGCVYMYKILRLWDVGKGWSVFCALFIIYFSPQVLRANAHFGLAFLCFFPMLLYWLIRYNKHGRILDLIYISAITTIFGFVHVYHIGFTLVLVLCYILSLLADNGRSLKTNFKHILLVGAAAIIPVIIFKGFLFLTDKVQDRPAFPVGFLNGTTDLKQIFTSTIAPLGYTFQFLFGNRASSGGEGYIYPGLLTIIFIFALIIIMVRSAFVKSRIQHPVPNYRIWLLIAFLCLFAGMGIPFIWGLDSLTEHLSSFRQLRSLGRFSWIFYYLITTYVSIWTFQIYQYLRKKGNFRMAVAFTFTLVSISIIQLSGYAKNTYRSFFTATNDYKVFNSLDGKSENSVSWLKKYGKSPAMFQSIIALPFFHVGSDKISLSTDCTDDEMRSVFRIALQSHLPIVNVMMSRTSWSRSFGIAKLLDGPFSKKEFIERFNDKSILLVVNTQCALAPGETQLLDYADYIGMLEGDRLYSLHLKKMIRSYETITDSVKKAILKQDKKEGLLDSDKFFYVTHFDKNKQEKSFAGEGALGNLPDNTTIAEIRMPASNVDRNYNLSVWSLCDSVNEHLSYFKIEQFNNSNELTDEGYLLTNKSTLINNFWFKSEKIITIRINTAKIKIIATGYNKSDNFLAIDELALWPVNEIYFSKISNKLVLIDNRPVLIQQ